MLKHTLGAILAVWSIAAFPGWSAAATITFDEFGDVGLTGPEITNQYAGLGVTFSSTAGNTNYVTTQPPYNGTPPNFLCSGPTASEINCAEETTLTFSSLASGITFQGLGINSAGNVVVANIDVYQNNVFAATLNVLGNAEGLNPVLVDLTAFSNVSSIRIYNITDGGGIGWDTFSFTTGATAVPEPATLLLLGGGVGATFLRRRRRA